MNSLSKEERNSIRTVKVVVEDHPNGLFMYAPLDDLKNAAKVLTSGVTGLMQVEPDSPGEALLRAHLAKHQIVITDIVATEAGKQLQALGFKPVESGADAVLKIDVLGYGFDQARPLSSELKGAVRLSANLYRGDATSLLNRRISFCGVFTDFQSHTTEQVLADPAIARDQFQRCSAIAFAEIAKGYGGPGQ